MPSTIKRRQIEKSLVKKGFVKEETHHTYFHHEYQGKRTGAYTYTSHGSNFQEYGITLLKRMSGPLYLESISQVEDLFNCPMDGDAYNAYLIEHGHIPREE